MATSSVPEHLLVKEVLHCCQGIDGGRYVWYQEDNQGSGYFGCGPDTDVSFTQQQLISKIAELGWLLRKVKELTDPRASGSRSVVQEALVAAALKEVNNYYRLIAILEAQAQKQTSLDTTTPDGKGPLSLRRLDVWLSEPLQRLRVLGSCLEAAAPLRGGEAINALHAISRHGDPLVRRVVGPFVDGACVPYLRYIVRWVVDGTLDAGADEFMIVSQSQGSESPSAYWHTKYILNKAMQPRFISDELAERILTAGKAVAFLRDCCGDAEVTEVITAHAADLDGNPGTHRQLRWLDAAVNDVAQIAGRRLADVVINRERLTIHLRSIKRYVLLGQGDFVRNLVDAAGIELDRPAKEINAYSLQGHVDDALRSCCQVVDDADVEGRVQVKLHRGMEGDRGWDIFGVTYNMSGPAGAVLSSEALAAYGRISRLMWVITHVDHVLSRSWHSLNAVTHGLNTLRALEKEHGIDLEAAEHVPALLRYLHARRAEMAQFVTGLQHHIVFEVIEPAWAQMLKALPKTEDLDGIVKVHDTALNTISEGMFLETTTGSNSSNVQSALRATLRSLLDIYGPVQKLTDAVDQAVSAQYAYLQRVKESEESGTWNEDVYNSPAGISEELLLEVRSGVWRVHSAFDRNKRTFESMLPALSGLWNWAFLTPGYEGGAADL